MISNEMEDAYILTYSNDKDVYGQRKTDTPTATAFEICMKKKGNFTNPNSPLYDDYDYIGITKNKSITELNRIEYNSKVYEIKHILITPRWTYLTLNEKR